MPREDTALPRESCGQAQHPDPHREGEKTGRKHTEATPEGHGHNRRCLQTLPGMLRKEGPRSAGTAVVQEEPRATPDGQG